MERDNLKTNIESLLSASVSRSYAAIIANSITDDVAEELQELKAAKAKLTGFVYEYTIDDMRMVIGKVLLKRTGGNYSC